VKRGRWRLSEIVLVAAALYVLASSVTFSLRHPWLTETEKLLSIHKVVTWGTVERPEVQP